MNCKLLIQYPENNPFDFVYKGIIDLDNAISEFNSFDWELQYKKIDKRTVQSLTSANPSITILNTDRNESLEIISDRKGNFSIYHQLDDKSGSDFISEDVTKNKEDVEVIDYIIAFYNNELDIELTPDDDTLLKNIEIGNHNPKRLITSNLWLLLIPFPVILLLIVLGKMINLLFLIQIISFFYASLLLIYSQFIVVFLQYLFKPRINSATINTDKSVLTLNYPDYNVKITKFEILQCVYTHTSNVRNTCNSLSNLIITLKDKQQYFLTTLTFTQQELYLLLVSMYVNYYKNDVFLPFIKTTIFQEEYNVDLSESSNKADLETLYAEYPDSMLNDIIKNESDYQPEAVKIAKNELRKRNHIHGKES